MGDYVEDNGAIQLDWANSAKAVLEDLYKQYDILKRIPFDDRFETVGINYDTVFNNLIKRWAEQSAALRATGVPIEGVVGDVFQWLESGAKQEDNFAWTHIADVVLYRFFDLVRQRVKTQVAKQITAVLKPNNKGSVTGWSVISHSLGCAITHDVLHAMDSTTPNEAGISILDSMVPSASVVAMIANVSKVLESDMQVYDSQVVPPTPLKPNTACFNYLSASHKLDPFLLPEKFDPKDEAEWKEAKKQKTFIDVRIDNIHEINVHSFKNYLVNPTVHIPLFERMAGNGTIKTAEKDAALAGFKKVPDTDVEDIAKKILKDSKVPAGESWLKRFGTFYGLLKDL